MQTKWSTCLSSLFAVTNGAKQILVLSTYIFSIYLCEFSVLLDSARLGCNCGGLSHLMFADDMCV